MRDEVIKMDHAFADHRNTFLINWSLGNTCNYSCSYCDAELNSGSIKWLPLDDVKAFCDKILDHHKAQSNKKVFFEFTGGEVTCNKHLIPFLAYLAKKNCSLAIFSNGWCKLVYWEEILPYLDHISLSFHIEHAEQTHFYHVAKFLNERVSTYINIMMLPARFKECEEYGKKILATIPDVSLNFQVLMNNLYSDHKLHTYTEQQLKRLQELHVLSKKHTNKYTMNSQRGFMRNYYADGTVEDLNYGEYIENGTNKWLGWICWAGVEQIVITSKGDVMRAWCVQDWLGNIYQNNVKFPRYPVFCTKPYCHCGEDIMIKKQKFVPL